MNTEKQKNTTRHYMVPKLCEYGKVSVLTLNRRNHRPQSGKDTPPSNGVVS